MPKLRNITAVLLLVCGTSHAQQYVDLITLQHSHSPGKGNDFSLSGSHFTESSADILLPIKLNERWTLITGAVAERTHFNDHSGYPILVHGMMLKVGLNIKHHEGLSGTYILLPRMASGAMALNEHTFQYGVLSLMKRTINEVFSFKYGVYGNHEFFGPFIVPVLGFYYQKNKWEMNVAMPINADIGYTLKKDLLTAGFRFDGISRSYFHFKDGDTYVEKSNNELGLYVRVSIKELNFRLAAGHSLWRAFSAYELNDRALLALPAIKFGDTRNALYTSSLDDIFFKLTLFYRLAIN